VATTKALEATRAPDREWTVMLRRHSAGAYEVICRDCGDDPACDYQEVPPRLQRVRGPNWFAAGVAEFAAHVEWHEPEPP
jgi:hypothetical protein